MSRAARWIMRRGAKEVLFYRIVVGSGATYAVVDAASFEIGFNLRVDSLRMVPVQPVVQFIYLLGRKRVYGAFDLLNRAQNAYTSLQYLTRGESCGNDRRLAEYSRFNFNSVARPCLNLPDFDTGFCDSGPAALKPCTASQKLPIFRTRFISVRR